MRRKIFLVLLIVWMGVIFCFSARDGDESSEDSVKVGLFVGNVIIRNFDEWTEDARIEFARKIDYPVRKTAHATEYMILTLFAFGAYYKGKKEERNAMKKIGFSFLTAAAYAATDEFHQVFVPGRAGMVQDVLIDSSGAFVGCLIILLLLAFSARRKPENK